MSHSFDTPFVSAETASFFNEAVSSVPNVKFVISPGNHDPIFEGGVQLVDMIYLQRLL